MPVRKSRTRSAAAKKAAATRKAKARTRSVAGKKAAAKRKAGTRKAARARNRTA